MGEEQPASGLDLVAYLHHLGYHGSRAPTVALLAELALRHPGAIAFENIDAFIGRRPSLDLREVQRKLVAGGRGGWCFEQNLLFGEALRGLGFDVTDLAGRVLWGRPPDAVTPRTHRLLRVRLDGRDWLVDAGFGGHTLTGVLDLHSEDEQATPHEPFRLRRLAGEERLLESLVAGQWQPLCRFDLQPQLPVDFEAANFQLSRDPASFFTQTLVVSRVDADGRAVLRGNVLSRYGREGMGERRTLGSAGEILDLLAGTFGLNTDGLSDLPARVEALLRAP